ncbi:MAG: response regulator [Terriglobales bacterium]|jgi:CheY-like chemotaxis protein
MKILVIEDSRFLRVAMEKVLTKAGYTVSGVADGREGLAAAHASLPALILLDMMLPGLDGTAVLKALKIGPPTARIPVIVLTGLSQKNEGRLKSAGAAAYVEKSSLNLGQNGDALIDAVEKLIGKPAAVLSPANLDEEVEP